MGRLEAKKGHEFLLQALRRVDRRGVGFRVVFVGDGALRVDLERIVAADGWQDRVVFTGHVPYGSRRISRTCGRRTSSPIRA